VLAATTDRLLGPDGLTARSPLFDRRAAIRAWCGQLPAGAPVRDVEALADRLLADPRVVPIDSEASSTIPGAERSFARLTTTEMLTVEQYVLDSALQGRAAGLGLGDPAAVEAALAAAPGLHPEQVTMVRALTGRGDLVQVVVGKAGSGKSHALAAAAQAWAASGLPVLGAAVAARAASELSTATAVPAMTVARLLSHAEHPGPHGTPHGLPERVVLVVDEAGMLGTRPLARLLRHVQHAEGCLVLVGDHHQLPELDAGGGFAALARRLDPILLDTNHRQEQPWERVALDELRTGDVPTALAAYDHHGRLHLHDSVEDQRTALVTAWWNRTNGQPATSLATDLATSLATKLATPTATGGDAPVLMLAARRADVDDLNRRARTLLATHGHLTDPVLQVSVEPGPDAPPGAAPVERCFAVGDRVTARTNHYSVGLLNGQTGTVVAVHPAAGSLDIRTPAGQLRLGPAYLTAGGLDHGYAITIHQAQGLTTDTTLLLGSSGLYREAGYVALSRGRVHNAVHLVEGPDRLAPETEPCQPRPRPTTAHPDHQPDELATSLRTTRAQAMASDLLDTASRTARPAPATAHDRTL
jgi:ATP-dependent exoDNAse (exonuclease V) alpha subunit